MAKGKAKAPVSVFVWSPNGNLAIARGSEVSIVNPKSGATTTTFDAGEEVENLVFGAHLVAYADGALRALVAGKKAKVIAEVDFARCLELSPDGALLTVVTQEMDSGPKMLSTYATKTWKRTASEPTDVGWGEVFLSPDAVRGVDATMNGATLFDVATRASGLKLASAGASPQLLAFSRNTNRVAGVNTDGMVQAWDTTTGKFLASFDGASETILAVDMSPDGKVIVTAPQHQPMRLWSVDQRKALPKRKEAPAEVESLVFDATGALVAALVDGALHVCDATTLKPLYTL